MGHRWYFCLFTMTDRTSRSCWKVWTSHWQISMFNSSFTIVSERVNRENNRNEGNIWKQSSRPFRVNYNKSSNNSASCQRYTLHTSQNANTALWMRCISFQHGRAHIWCCLWEDKCAAQRPFIHFNIPEFLSWLGENNLTAQRKMINDIMFCVKSNLNNLLLWWNWNHSIGAWRHRQSPDRWL